jgi:hypothetical protein
MEAVATDTPARSATSFRVAIDDSDHTIFRPDIHRAHTRSLRASDSRDGQGGAVHQALSQGIPA